MGNFFDRDKGWREFIENAKRAEGQDHVMVGLLRSSGEYKPKERQPKEPGSQGWKSSALEGPPITVAQVGAIHEFGTKDGRIPERSWIRSTMAEQDRKLKRMIKKFSADIALGRIDRKRALGLIGEFLKNALRNKIQEGVPPPNAASTVSMKGSDHPLVDTGQMRNSIDYQVRSGKKNG